MAQDVTSKTIHTSYKKMGGVDQQKVVAKLYAEKSNSIAKILCTNVLVCSYEAEVLNKEARYQAKLRFEVVYLAQDGSFYTITDTMDISGRIQNESLLANMHPLVSSNVIDTQITSLNNDMVELTSIVDTVIDVIANDEVTFVESVNSRIVAQMEKFDYCNMLQSERAKFRVIDEYEVKENIGRLLMASAHLCNQQITPGTGYVTIKGSVHLNLTYETETEPKQIKSVSHMFDFKEEVSAQSATPNSLLLFTSNVLGDEINVVGNRVNDNTSLKVSVGLCYNLTVMEQQEADAVVDAFSLDNNINLTVESFNKCKLNEVIVESKRITSSVIIDDNQGEIENIAAHCGGGVFIANAYATAGAVQIEGVVHGDVIYEVVGNEDELNYESASVEIPFSTELSNALVNENTLVSAQVAIKKMDARRKRGKELEVEVELCMFVQLNENEQEAIIQKIEETDNDTSDEIALRMFVVRKNNNLWDVCKRTSSTPEMIMEQNPNVTFPVSEDTILIIYKQKE